MVGLQEVFNGLTDNVDEFDTDLFEFSSGPLPRKKRGILQVFYNNINGLEINHAISQAVRNKKVKKNSQIIENIEQYTKIESLLKKWFSGK